MILPRSNWFTITQIRDGVYLIDDAGHDNIFLIVGDKKALLVDTGWGVGGLKNLIAEMTGKPLLVINTHGHFDHALGNDQFDEVMIGQGDLSLLDDIDVQMKRDFVINSNSVRTDSDPIFHSLGGTHARRSTVEIQDATSFNLGGRVVHVHLVPGHTYGSLCLIDDKTRTLFTGDMYVPLQEWNAMWFHFSHSAPLHVARKSIAKMISLSHDYDTMISSHGLNAALEPWRLNELLDGLDSIIAGITFGKPIQTLVGEGLLAVFPHVGVVYNPSNR